MKEKNNTKADYIYKNKDDTIRIKILKHGASLWDYDVFNKNGDFETFSEEAGDIFSTKRAAKAWAEKEYGKLISLGNIEAVTEGWNA